MEDDLPDIRSRHMKEDKGMGQKKQSHIQVFDLSDDEADELEDEQLPNVKKKIVEPESRAVTSKVVPVSDSAKKYEEKKEEPKDDGPDINTIMNMGAEFDRKIGFLNPKSKFRARWDIWMVLLLLYTAVLVPYEIAFLGDAKQNPIDPLFVWNRFVDLLFLLDMMFNFMTPFQDKETLQTIYDKRLIAANYFKGWFPIDFVSILPFDVVGLLMQSEEVGQLKTLRLIRLLRLMKLVRVFRASRIFSRWESALGLSFAVLKLFKFVFGTLTLAHWLACLWGLTPVLEDNNYSWMHKYTAVVVKNGDGPITAELGIQDEPPSYRYVAALYWAVMTLTTIGYGDIIPATSAERFVVIICMMVGGGVYAYVVGAVCGIVASMDEATTEFNQQMDHLNVYMEKVNAPKPMRIKLREYFLHSKDLLQHKYWSQVINVLSPGLRGEFSVHTNGAWITKVPFFNTENLDEKNRFIAAITQEMKAELYPPQEAIINLGDPTSKMYIVSKGLVARLGKVMGKGNFFGEDVILTHGTRHYSVLTLTYVDTYSLSREDLFAVLNQNGFPSISKTIKQQAVYLALQRKLQALYSELVMWRVLGKAKSSEFEKNWLRKRLLGTASAKQSPFDKSMKGAIAALERASSCLENALECKIPARSHDTVSAVNALTSTALDLLFKHQKHTAAQDMSDT